jgi:hypothetical protein
MANKRLRDKDLVPILTKAISNAEHYVDGKLSTERQEVEKYYRGELPLPLHKGDSKYVSRDVFDAVDSMRATVVESFMASSRIVFFRPENGEDVAGAKQATEYCRHVFFKQNNGEDILYDVVTDGLTKRMSVVKVYHDHTEWEEEYEFEELTPEEITMEVEKYDNFDFVSVDVDDETGLYSGTFKVTEKTSMIKAEVIQPEDLIVSSRTANLEDARFVAHRVSKSRSDLLKEGYDEKLVDKIKFSGQYDMDRDYEKQLRFEPVDDIFVSDESYQAAVEEANLYEIYIKLDMYGTGRDRLWKILYCGDIILEKERVARMPFASFVPLPVPHTFFGDNYAKSVIPIQNARTVLIRQIINHSLVTNNPRQQVLQGTLNNPKELLENRMGGIVNVRRLDGIAPIPQAPLNPFIFNLISMIDADKEEVTGVSQLSQGLSKDAISTQNSEGMVEQLISQSQQRQRIVARRFGKFLRELYFLIYHCAIEYIDQEEIIEVSGVQAEINPSEWESRTSASIELTLGYSEQQREAQKWVDIDQYIKNDPILSAGYDYARSYQVAQRFMENRGIEDIATILTPPEEMQPQEPSEAETLQMEQMRSQIEYQKAQGQAMIAKAETDRMRAEADLIRARAEAGFKGEKTAIDAEKFIHERWMDIEELDMAKASPIDSRSVSLNPNE